MIVPPNQIQFSPTLPTRTLPRARGFKPISLAIGLKGEAIRLLVRDSSAEGVFAKTEQAGWASFPKSQTEAEYAAVLSICDAYGEQEIKLRNLTATFPIAQVLPDGEILVVAPRCQRFKDGTHEQNASVYDASGLLQRQFLLGDGIEDVQVDRKGNIWVSYFDEGVFGNYGWGHEIDRFGTAGLSCFDSQGKKLWDFQPPPGVDAIADCYALNVSNDGIWAYYYTDFPVVRVDSSGNVRAWKTKTSGGRGFAVHDKHVLLYGGYGEEKTSCKLLQLDHDFAEVVAEVKLSLPEHIDLSKATVVCRGNVLNVFLADKWQVFSIASLSKSDFQKR